MYFKCSLFVNYVDYFDSSSSPYSSRLIVGFSLSSFSIKSSFYFFSVADFGSGIGESKSSLSFSLSPDSPSDPAYIESSYSSGSSPQSYSPKRFGKSLFLTPVGVLSFPSAEFSYSIKLSPILIDGRFWYGSFFLLLLGMKEDCFSTLDSLLAHWLA